MKNCYLLLALLSLFCLPAQAQLLPGQVDPRFNPDDDGLQSGGHDLYQYTDYNSSRALRGIRFEGTMADGRSLVLAWIGTAFTSTPLGYGLYLTDTSNRLSPVLRRYPFHLQHPERYGNITGGKPATDGGVYILVDSTVRKLGANGYWDDAYHFAGSQRVARVAYVDAQNRLYAQEHLGAGYTMKRYLADGSVDGTFALASPYNAFMCATPQGDFFWTTVAGNDDNALSVLDSSLAIKTNATGQLTSAPFIVKLASEVTSYPAVYDGYSAPYVYPTAEGGMVIAEIDFGPTGPHMNPFLHVRRYLPTGVRDAAFPVITSYSNFASPNSSQVTIVNDGTARFLLFGGDTIDTYSMQTGALLLRRFGPPSVPALDGKMMHIYPSGHILLDVEITMRGDFSAPAVVTDYNSYFYMDPYHYKNGKALLSISQNLTTHIRQYQRRNVAEQILIDETTGDVDTSFRFTPVDIGDFIVPAGNGFIGKYGLDEDYVYRRLANGAVDTGFRKSFFLHVSPSGGQRGGVTRFYGMPDGGCVLFVDTGHTNALIRMDSTGRVVTTMSSLDNIYGSQANMHTDPQGNFLSTVTSKLGVVINRISVGSHNEILRLAHADTVTHQSWSQIWCFEDGGYLVNGGPFTVPGISIPVSYVYVNADGSIDIAASGKREYNKLTHPIDLYIETCGVDNKGRYLLSKAEWPILFYTRYLRSGEIDPEFIPLTVRGSIESLSYTSDDALLIPGVNFISGVSKTGLFRVTGGDGQDNYLNHISGTINARSNASTICNPDTADRHAATVIVSDPLSGYYTASDSSGSYHLPAGTGTARASVVGRYGQAQPVVCPVAQHYDVPFASLAGADSAGRDFLLHAPVCADLSVRTLSSMRARPCSRRTSTLYYANNGYRNTDTARLVITLPDSSIFIGLFDAYGRPIPSLRFGNNVSVSIGRVAAGASGYITFADSIPCRTSLVGRELCLSADIYPKAEQCMGRQADGAQLRLTQNCANGSAAFEVRNLGQAMSLPGSLAIFRQDSIYGTVSVQLGAGGVQTIPVPANGQGVVAELFYGPDATSQYVVARASCNTNLGYGEIFAGPASSSTCVPIRYSYDPNEKIVSPTGFDAEGSVRPGIELEYTLHFENTGSDDAFYIRVADTLDAALDPATLHVLGSTHPVQIRLSGKAPHIVADFVFSPISLPPTRQNPAASSGAVRFGIKSKASTPLGTVITNEARIYFDNNPPILTNPVRSRLGLPAGVTATHPNLTVPTRMQIWPNPSQGSFTVALPAAPVKGQQLYIRSATGALVRTLPCTSTQVQVSGLAPGLYEVQIWPNISPAIRVAVVK